jgi:hypothetical protein
VKRCSARCCRTTRRSSIASLSDYDARPHRVERNFAGVRVVEIATNRPNTAGWHWRLGADVIKIEPPGGSPTRRIGPSSTTSTTRASLYFWHYNTGKRSVVLDLEGDTSARVRLPSVARAGRCADRVDTHWVARRARLRPSRAAAALSRVDRRANVAVRRRRPVGRLQGIRPRAPQRSGGP